MRIVTLEFLEYPKHKPETEFKYYCILKGNTINLLNFTFEKGFYSSLGDGRNLTSFVTHFAPYHLEYVDL